MMQVLALYKSNTCHLDVFRNELRCMKNLIGDSDQFLIVGDFNIDVSSSQNKALLTELEAVFGVEQLISQSTTLYSTIIDLAFSNSGSVHTMIIDSVISDHKMIANSVLILITQINCLIKSDYNTNVPFSQNKS